MDILASFVADQRLLSIRFEGLWSGIPNVARGKAAHSSERTVVVYMQAVKRIGSVNVTNI